MSIEQEIELKTLISKQTFEHLHHLFATQLTHVSQTNYYYDTPTGTLKSQKQALRIRKSDKKTVITLKTKLDALSSQEITSDYNTNLITSIHQHEQLRNVITSPETLVKIANFTTNRSFCPLPFGTLFLDFTQYENNAFDYELEIELFNSKDIAIAQQWLSQHTIEYTAAPPKIARAIASQ